MVELSAISKTVLYTCLVVYGLYAPVLLWGQIKILAGQEFNNPDGSIDSWREQKSHYGMAFADIFVSVPATVIGIIGALSNHWIGYYLLTLISFWFVWANVMTTATSLKFYRPKITTAWFFAFPFGIILGLVYLIWSIMNFGFISALYVM